MPSKALETLRAGYAAFNRGDLDSIFEMGPPDFELQTADRVTNPGTYRGRDEARRFFDDLFAPFDEVLIEPEQYLANGDQVVVLVTIRSRPRGSSAVVENRIAHVWTVRDDELVRLHVFPEREKGLEAAGLAGYGTK